MRLAGQVIIGTAVSSRVYLANPVEVFPHSSVAVNKYTSVSVAPHPDCVSHKAEVMSAVPQSSVAVASLSQSVIDTTSAPHSSI